VASLTRLLVLLSLLFAAPAVAQGLTAPPPAVASAPASVPLIGRIVVTGTVSTDTLRVKRTFEVKPGDELSRDAIRRGTRKLSALGVFDNVWVNQIDREDGLVDLEIVVKERPRLARFTFQGNEKKSTPDLEHKLFLRLGEVYSPTATRTQVDTLLKVYREAGYGRARVETRLDTLPENKVGLTFVVSEGQKVRITAYAFEGVTAFPAKKLAKQLKSKKRGFFGGGEPDEANFSEDRDKLEAWYRNHGYRDARLVEETLVDGAKPRDLTLRLRIEEGPFYRMGNVAWAGNQVVPGDVLAGLWKPRPDERYDASRIEKATQSASAEYWERGYLYIQLEPAEQVRDSLVDVTFNVTEGRPSAVRYVRISGNKGTREKVIRREIDIHEGDRFKRSALVRTQGDLSRLGLFEDVQVDFAPAESTDVDILLKVKEKQVGTASAGAGYTNETGVTGFLELGHNNVLGNGQSLSLHLERGSKREDYSLSFTEPWFRDTPTLLGFSAYNTMRDYDLYTQKRVGGSGRIGRPLPWPDYSRGSVSYSLEDVTISDLGTATSTADSVVLSTLRVGRAVRTSSVSTYFLRNSADNAFYPTKGTRFSLETEVAGGPFGGSVNFHKHRLDARIWLPSGIKHVTTMVNARMGFVAEYLDQNSSIPAYERFRLGGGTTVDPLRGYDDYQVVPGKFDRFVTAYTISGYDTTFVGTTIVSIDTTYSQTRTRVRYPGGRFMTTFTVEEQFPIMHPLHGVVFFDAGNTWDRLREVRPFDLKMGAGIGFRLEIPLLGNIGFDYGYGFNRDDGPRAVGHFLIGNQRY
jgi:outer membrane protein insertion porin family